MNIVFLWSLNFAVCCSMFLGLYRLEQWMQIFYIFIYKGKNLVLDETLQYTIISYTTKVVRAITINKYIFVRAIIQMIKRCATTVPKNGLFKNGSKHHFLIGNSITSLIIISKCWTNYVCVISVANKLVLFK